MPWTKHGDNAATHPKLMATAAVPGADDRTVNEVAGWISRCGWQSAGHMTDYIIDVGTAYMLGGSRTAELVRICKRTGLLFDTELDGLPAFRLINDPEFIHIRLKKEIEWERQQKRDTADPHILVHVRRRDGDNCRWCGVLVQWRGKRSARTAWPDHLIPGEAGTVDTMVVACFRCQTSRQDNPQWVDDHPLRPAPVRPNYGKWTAGYLTEHGYPTEPNIGPDMVIDPTSADTAPAAPQAAQERPAAGPDTDTSRTAVPDRTAPSTGPKSVTRPLGTSKPGSGREGQVTGQVGTGLAGTGRVGSPPSAGAPSGTKARRRRGRRGGRRS